MARKKILIFLSLVSVFAFTTIASATKVWEGKDFESTFNVAKSNFENSINSYKNTRENYLELLNKFKAQACKVDNPSCQKQKDELVSRAKDYLLKIKNSMAKYLGMIKTEIENTNASDLEKTKLTDEITKDIEWLDSKETEINDLATAEDVQSKAQEFKNFWSGEEIKIKKYAGNIASWKIEAVLDKLDDVVSKIDKRLNELDKESFDVFTLQGKLNEIKDKLLVVKAKATEAKIIFNALTLDNISSFTDGKTKLKEASTSLKEIYADLKSFTGEINQDKLKKVEGDISKLKINGDGVVNLTGNLTVSGTVSKDNFQGTLTIKDSGSDSQIETFGKGDKVEMGDGWTQYKNIEKFEIKGSNITLEISSGFIEIEVKGKGDASMQGNGLYKLKDSEWTDIPKTEIKIEI